MFSVLIRHLAAQPNRTSTITTVASLRMRDRAHIHWKRDSQGHLVARWCSTETCPPD